MYCTCTHYRDLLWVLERDSYPGLFDSWPTKYYLSYPSHPVGATSHLILAMSQPNLSYVVPLWATPHHIWALSHPSELRCILGSDVIRRIICYSKKYCAISLAWPEVALKFFCSWLALIGQLLHRWYDPSISLNFYYAIRILYTRWYSMRIILHRIGRP